MSTGYHVMRAKLRLYHGGTLNEPRSRVWATPEHDYATEYAQLHKAELWALDVELSDGEILDLTACGRDTVAVAAALAAAGIAATSEKDATQPASVLRRVRDAAILAAGYRAVRIWEWNDWKSGAGQREVLSLCLVDLGAIQRREASPLPVPVGEPEAKPPG